MSHPMAASLDEDEQAGLLDFAVGTTRHNELAQSLTTLTPTTAKELLCYQQVLGPVGNSQDPENLAAFGPGRNSFGSENAAEGLHSEIAQAHDHGHNEVTPELPDLGLP